MPAAATAGSVSRPLKKYGLTAGPASVTPPLVDNSTSLPSSRRRTDEGARYRYASSAPLMRQPYGHDCSAETPRAPARPGDFAGSRSRTAAQRGQRSQGHLVSG